MNERERDDVDIYPVGLLHNLMIVGRITVRAPRYLPRVLRRFGRDVGRGWRRRSYWNGWLAEPVSSRGTWARAGHGWTRKRALRDLDRHLGETSRP